MENDYEYEDYMMSNDSECLNLNEELWDFRGDYTTRWPTMVLFGFFYTIIIVFGIIGNTCVIRAITMNKSLQTVPNLFILSLSCSDIVVLCISATITPITAFKKEWIFGEALCRIAPFIAGISLCFSTFTLTAISVDRYMLIRFPMKKPLSHTQAGMVIGLICVLAAAITSPIMFRQKLSKFANFCGLYCTEDWTHYEEQRKVYGAALLGVQLVVPLTIIIISYTAISLRIGQNMILKGAKKQTNNNWEVQLTDQQRMAVKRKQRTNRMLIAMVVAFSLSWIWSVSFNVLRDYEYIPQFLVRQEYLVGIATHCVAMTSTVWNPLLYAMLNLQLRAAFIALMPVWIKELLGLETEKHSPLLATERTTKINKYGSTRQLSGQKMGATSCLQEENNDCRGVSACIGGPVEVLEKLSTNSSRVSRESSTKRKPSAIRVFVQRIRTADAEQEELLLGESSSSSQSIEMECQQIRRMSASYTEVIHNQYGEMTIVRTTSF